MPSGRQDWDEDVKEKKTKPILIRTVFLKMVKFACWVFRKLNIGDLIYS